MTGARLWAQDGSEDEPPEDSDGEDPETAAAGCRGPTPGQAPAGGAGAEGKGLFPGSTLPPPLPLGFRYAVSPYFHTGGHPHTLDPSRGHRTGRPPVEGSWGEEGPWGGKFPFGTHPPPQQLGHTTVRRRAGMGKPARALVTPHNSGAVGGLSVDGEEAPAPEDVTKWTVDDVCSFVGGLSGCGEYTRVRGGPSSWGGAGAGWQSLPPWKSWWGRAIPQRPLPP